MLLSAFVVLAVGASPAHAAFGIKNWEALTCKENVDEPAGPGLPPLPPAAGQCTKDTESQWYTQASGHPNFGITDFELNNKIQAAPNLFFEGFPEGFIKDDEVHLPEGLNVNPEATPTCTLEQAENEEFTACATETLGQAIVGTNYFTIALKPPTSGECVEVSAELKKCPQLRAEVPVFNVEPFQGVPSMVAFPSQNAKLEPTVTFIVGDLDPTDQSVIFRVTEIPAPGPPMEGLPVVGSRLVFNGRAGDGTYLTMPSNCDGGQTTTLRVDSWEGAEDTKSFTTALGAEGCEEVEFNPDVDVNSTGDTDSPDPATVKVKMPFEPEAEGLENSRLMDAKIVMPEGTSLNPSVANGLETCSDAQFGKGTDNPIQCPAASKIGTVEVISQALDQPLEGNVYVGEPLNQNPSSGEMFRIFIHAFNTRYGVNVRLVGNVTPDQETGRLTAVVAKNPQQPFEEFIIHIEGGPHGALTSPFTCGPHESVGTFTPWGTPEVETKTVESEYELATAPGGGPCPKTLADRPFDPGYTAGTTNPKAGAYSPFELHLLRSDGSQEFRKTEVTLPPGMAAKLAGVTYCPEGAIEAASSRSGMAELASPSCPSSSLVGDVTIKAGSGVDPYTDNLGKAYFAGPYKGAPVSLVFIVPAVAGPYDLGTDVVRTALNIEPETTVVTAVSDDIPFIMGGVKLDIRSIDVNLNRNSYVINPTNCSPFGVNAYIFGGGANPNEPTVWNAVNKNVPFTATDCNALKFKPKFSAKILGGKKAAKRRQHPKLQAVLQGRFPGDANVARAAFTLPKTTILDQSNIKTICTRVQLAASSCPKGSVYGHAKATSPLLSGALKGPVYLTSSSNKLPDLLVDLKGQVNIRLRGVISSKGGKLKTTFRKVPDAAVKKFTLEMNGGKKGLLINTSSLCKTKQFAKLNLKAQNGKQLKNNKLRIKTPCGKGKKKKGKGKK
ncbi:MAG TPA: hypothetical protein VGF09_05930 [Solirubrobacterales bacterium]